MLIDSKDQYGMKKTKCSNFGDYATKCIFFKMPLMKLGVCVCVCVSVAVKASNNK